MRVPIGLILPLAHLLGNFMDLKAVDLDLVKYKMVQDVLLVGGDIPSISFLGAIY